jgi:hypothetical protein
MADIWENMADMWENMADIWEFHSNWTFGHMGKYGGHMGKYGGHMEKNGEPIFDLGHMGISLELNSNWIMADIWELPDLSAAQQGNGKSQQKWQKRQCAAKGKILPLKPKISGTERWKKDIG